ncbi:MAG TPA: globin domain-containing protein [Gemmatimonadales bacterium]|nr:globin domain-containing protein [Gemmatimonadales bacterium]
MRPETVRIVRESWRKFEPVAVPSAAFFYAKLFELDPEAERLFARTDMNAQGHKVMGMFAEIVHALDRPEVLVGELAELARRHVHYGVRDSQYDSVGTAMLWTLERGLGPDFTDEVRDAWTEAYLLVSTVVRRASAREQGSPR